MLLIESNTSDISSNRTHLHTNSLPQDKNPLLNAEEDFVTNRLAGYLVSMPGAIAIIGFCVCFDLP